MRATALAALLGACASPYAPALAPSASRSVVQLAASGDASCALLADGSVRCWGSWREGDSHEALVSLVPRPFGGLEHAASIALHGERLCAVDAAGEVWCGTLRGDVRAAGIQQAVDVVVDADTACARLASARVICWDGQRRREMARGVLQLVAWGGRYAARLDDGRVVSWSVASLDAHLEELQVDATTELFVARHTLCARLWQGGWWCSGHFGGDVPVQLAGTKDVVASAGECALTGAGRVCCGLCDDPAIAALRDVVQLVAGNGHHCALEADGDVWCWGSNAAGQLGDAISATPRPVEVPIATPAESIAATSSLTCAATAGRVTCWGEQEHLFRVHEPRRWRAPIDAGVLAFNHGRICAYSDHAVECDGHGSWRLVRHDGTPLRLGGPVVFAGGLAAAVLDDGHPMWWRASHAAPRVNRPAAVVREVDDVVELAFHGATWYALRADGSVLQQRCQGNMCAPSRALASCRLPQLAGIVALTARGTNACAVTREGRVLCWRDAASCADGAFTASAVPGVEGATRVTLGDAHGCALLESGAVACWGNNDWGQLGNGGYEAQARATHVAGLVGAVELALGSRHSCARLRDGAVRCWGDMRLGQMGDGANRMRSAPLRMRGLVPVR